ncbi:MAG: hypothetical protein ACK44M_06240, partial [Chloroflexus sp.]
MIPPALKNQQPAWNRPLDGRQFRRPLPWLILASLLLLLLLISCVISLMINQVAPRMEWFSGDVSNIGRVDYSLWSGGPQLPP